MANLFSISEALLEKTFQTNLFGAIKVTQAVLPHFRERRAGKLAYMGSGFGWAPLPCLTLFGASKAGLSSTRPTHCPEFKPFRRSMLTPNSLLVFVEGLHKEVAPFNIRAVVFEIGGFHSPGGRPNPAAGEPNVGGGYPTIEDYQPIFADTVTKITKEIKPKIPNDAAKLPGAIISILTSQDLAAGKPFPVRVAIGIDSLRVVRQKCQEQLKSCDEWEDVSVSVVKDGASTEVNEVLMKSCSMLGITG